MSEGRKLNDERMKLKPKRKTIYLIQGVDLLFSCTRLKIFHIS